jgi:hypothetical protein
MRVILQILALVGLSIVAIMLLAAARTFTPKHADVATSTAATNMIATSTDAASAADLIHVTFPQVGAAVSSPLKVTGEARGGWYFEASFPVTVVDWDGKIIGQGPVQAKGDWMTTDFVPFGGAINFVKPKCAAGTDYCKRGSVIFKNDNPSGQASTSYAVEIPVIFQ